MHKSNMAISFFKKMVFLLVYNGCENIKYSLQSKNYFVLTNIKVANSLYIQRF